MWAALGKRLLLAGLYLLIWGHVAYGQSVTERLPEKLPSEILTAIGIPEVKLSPILAEPNTNALPVRLFYEGPPIKGDLSLTITIERRITSTSGRGTRPLSQSTLYLDGFDRETDAFITLPKIFDGLQIKAALRDENQNLVLQTAHPLPILSKDLRILKLVSIDMTDRDNGPIPDITAVETITGKIILPRRSAPPDGSILHVQLLEHALAGGLSMQMAAQDTRSAVLKDGSIAFEIQRGIWEGRNDPDLAFKAWISDPFGRKIFLMNKPVSYNGPEVEYTIPLESLKQGKDTKRGQYFNPGMMAQTLVQGIAEFDPINGIPGQARLKIELKQDRGDYNLNPVVSEQTLLLRGMETSIAFNLTTDSTHFDPYVPAPFLSVSLTDSFGRVYYASGDIRAREDDNFVRLYPR